MPSNHLAIDMFADKPLLDGGSHEDLLKQRVGYAIKKAEDPEDIDYGGCEVLFRNGVIFHRDPDDLLSPHDGVSVIKGIGSARFKSNVIGQVFAVISRVTVAPGGESLGDQYLVRDVATGVFAGHDKEIALFTPWGWHFVVPNTGYQIYVKAELGYYHFNNSAAWESGLGAFTVVPGSIQAFHLAKAFGTPAEAEQNTPPVSPADGQMWLVGASPTGAWAGQNGKAAFRYAGAWTFIAPGSGAVVFDKNLGIQRQYTGASWVDLFTSGLLVYRDSHYETSTLTFSTALTTDVTFTRVALASNNIIEITWSGEISFSTENQPLEIGLYVDAEVTPRQVLTSGNESAKATFSVTLEATPGDTASHDYHIKLKGTSAANQRFRRNVVIREYIA